MCAYIFIQVVIFKFFRCRYYFNQCTLSKNAQFQIHGNDSCIGILTYYSFVKTFTIYIFLLSLFSFDFFFVNYFQRNCQNDKLLSHFHVFLSFSKKKSFETSEAIPNRKMLHVKAASTQIQTTGISSHQINIKCIFSNHCQNK